MAELARLYHELAQRGAPSVGAKEDWPYEPEGDEHLLAIAGEMLRYDPRLLSVLLQWTLASWESWHLQVLRRWMHRMRTPQALAVLFSFARTARRSDAELGYAVDYLCAGWTRVDPPERFFFGVERPGSRRAARRRGRSLAQYSRWGFSGTERPTVDAFTKQTVGQYDAETRRAIARSLADTLGEVSLQRYLDAIDHSTNRQQARQDLRSAGLVPSGHGRGATWRLDAAGG